MSKIVKYAGYVNATGICGLFDAWTVKFDKILGVVFRRSEWLKFTRPLDAGIGICRSLQAFGQPA